MDNLTLTLDVAMFFLFYFRQIYRMKDIKQNILWPFRFLQEMLVKFEEKLPILSSSKREIRFLFQW
jgi:hypothetical protein